MDVPLQQMTKQSISFPKIRKESSRLPTLPSQARQSERERGFARYNTEIFSHDCQKHPCNQAASKPLLLLNERQRSRIANKPTDRKPTEIIRLLDLNRNLRHSNRRQEAVRIIDARKSIKILVDFFNEKHQDSRDSNGKHHLQSPKRRPVNLVEVKHTEQNYHAMGKVKASKQKKSNNSLDRSLRVDCLDKMKGGLRQHTINLDSYVNANSISLDKINVNNTSLDKIRKTRVKQSIVRQEQIVILNEKHHWVASKQGRKKIKTTKEGKRAVVSNEIEGWATRPEESHYIE